MARGIGIALLLVVAAIAATEGSYLSAGYRKLGIRLAGHGIRYHKYYYGRRCGVTKLYGALRACNKKYHGLTRCFPALYKKGLLGRRHIYRRHGKGYGLGVKFIKRGIVYHNKYYGFRRRRRLCMRYLTQCYHKYHKTGTCMRHLSLRGYIGKAHAYKKTYKRTHKGVHRYSARGLKARYYKLHGFKLDHNRLFNYGGHGYRLRCGTHRFYNIWSRCYTKFHKVGRCFGLLKRHRLFYAYKGKGYSSSGLGLSAKYLKYHGPALHNRRFYYKKRAFAIKCSPNKWFGYYNACYHSRHSVSKCLGLLHRKHLFYTYKGKGYSSSGLGLSAKYLKYHGPALHNRRFYYKKRDVRTADDAFSIKCSPNKWYGYYNACYHSKHSVSGCLGLLHRKHLFYLYKAKGHLANAVYKQKKVAAYHVKAVKTAGYRHIKAINTHAHHQVKHLKRVGKIHAASVHRLAKHHLKKLHYIIKDHMHKLKKQSIRHRYAKEKQHKQQMYQREHQNKKHLLYRKVQNSQHKAYIANAIYALKARYLQLHGFNLAKGGFVYGGRGYHLDCSEKLWYTHWSSCYSTYNDVNGCLYRLRKQHLIHYVNAAEGMNDERGYGEYDEAKESGNAEYGLEALYLKAHGLKLIDGNAFNYHGMDYLLTCSTDQWYEYWNKYYPRYNSVSGCLKYLHSLQLFHHKGYSSSGYMGYLKGLEGTYLKSHGLQLSEDGLFNYAGKDYRIRCNRARFYKYWNKCYARHHDVGGCVNRLYKYHLVNLNAAKRYLANAVNLHKKIASNHVAYIHKASKVHVATMNKLAHNHISNINRAGHVHVAKVVTATKAHLHKLHYIVKAHLNVLRKHTQKHLSAKEAQHKRHQIERERQNRKHLLQREIQNRKHKAYLSRTVYGLKAAYLKFGGLPIHHGGFTFNGRGYHLSCSERRFFKYWSGCYKQYSSRSGCIGRLGKLGLLSDGYQDYDYKSEGGAISGYGPETLYLKSGGLRLHDNVFHYHGKDYAITCDNDKWYEEWVKTYSKYHSVDASLKYLHDQQLFHHKGYSSSAYDNYIHGLEGNYLTSQGPKLSSSGVFSYGGKDYRIRSSPARFYGIWNKCYGRHPSVSTCFNQLHHYHLFNMYNAKKYVADAVYQHKKIATNHVEAVHKLAHTHVASMNKLAHNHISNINRAGHVHVAKVAAATKAHLHKLHYIVKAHLNVLRKQTQKHLSAKEAQHKRHQMERERQNRNHLLEKDIQNKKHKAYLANTVLGLKAAYLKFSGLPLHNGGFTYHGIGYHLSCSERRWYQHWSGCYKKYSSVSGCVGRLGKLGLLSRLSSEGYGETLDGGQVDGADYGEKGEAGGDEYGSTGYGEHMEHGDGYDHYEGNGKDSYDSYMKGLEHAYLHSHGLKVSNGIVNYGGKAFSLRCSVPHFYGAWNKCYTSQHSVQGCFDQLYKSHLLTLNAAKMYLQKTVHLQKKIVNNHLQTVHRAAKTHMTAMHQAGKAHLYRIQKTAHAHTVHVAAATHKHMKKLHAVVRAHLNILKTQTLKHLKEKEAQHRRHQLERAMQHKKQLVQREILNKKHKVYLAQTLVGLKAAYLNNHGFALHDGGFTYGGKGYRIACSAKQWYEYWSGCYSKYHSESGCLGRLSKLGYINLIEGYGPAPMESGQGYDGYDHQHNEPVRTGPNYDEQGYGTDGYGPNEEEYGLEATYLKYHGMQLHDGGKFSYGNKGYKLNCSPQIWYNRWNHCYGEMHSVSGCMERLHNEKLYVLSQAVHLMKKITAHHVKAVHHAAKVHLTAMNKAAHIHLHNIKKVGHVHAATVAVKAKQHIHRFNAIIQHGLRKLKKQAQMHLIAKENQHRRHHAERQKQNILHLKEKEIQHQKHKQYLAGSILALKSAYLNHHGPNLINGGFSYHGTAYHLSCGEKQWYGYWNDCYHNQESVEGCIGYLGKRGYISSIQAIPDKTAMGEYGEGAGDISTDPENQETWK